MERYKEGESRYQLGLHLTSYDDMIGTENPVRAIDAIVNNMEIPLMGFQYTNVAVTGRKAYNPGDMVKLYTYTATLTGFAPVVR